MSETTNYTWRIGDVFASGEHRWKVIAIEGERAVLQSCASSFATTIPLTFNEWHEGGRWKLESMRNMVADSAPMRKCIWCRDEDLGAFPSEWRVGEWVCESCIRAYLNRPRTFGDPCERGR